MSAASTAFPGVDEFPRVPGSAFEHNRYLRPAARRVRVKIATAADGTARVVDVEFVPIPEEELERLEDAQNTEDAEYRETADVAAEPSEPSENTENAPRVEAMTPKNLE